MTTELNLKREQEDFVKAMRTSPKCIDTDDDSLLCLYFTHYEGWLMAKRAAMEIMSQKPVAYTTQDGLDRITALDCKDVVATIWCEGLKTLGDVPLYTAPASNDRLLQIIACAYQMAGVHDALEVWLDVLANPEEATQEQIDALLPYAPEIDHGDTVLKIQGALGITTTGWISPDVILLRIKNLQTADSDHQGEIDAMYKGDI